jgi:hypothetical protein
MPHRQESATPKVKDAKRPLDITSPFMDGIEARFHPAPVAKAHERKGDDPALRGRRR